jgi:hypothetical protein
MSYLANRKLRTKLLLALAPLALMVVVAALYSSTESKLIDAWYSELIDKDVSALRSSIEARALTMRFGFFLYKLIAEPDPDKMRVIEGNLDETYTDYQAVVAEAARESPSRAKKIKEAEALFEKAVADARPVRAATLMGDNTKSLLRNKVYNLQAGQTHAAWRGWRV